MSCSCAAGVAGERPLSLEVLAALVALVAELRGGQGVALRTQSDHGSRCIERILSIGETMRLQDGPVLDSLIESATATRAGQTAPSPLAASP